MEMRKLNGKDFGKVCKILSGIGIKEFKNCFTVTQSEVDESGVSLETIGIGVVFDIAGIILENFDKVSEDLNVFLSSLTGMKVDEISNMEFADYGELIIEVCMKDEFRDFFKRAMKLFNR